MSTTSNIISKDLELRHLSMHHQSQLLKLLDIDDSVLNLLMGNIVKQSNSSSVPELRFNSSDIDAIREHSQRHKMSPIHVLLDEWSTMGQNRPKMKDLLSLLVKCQLFQAADYIADLIDEQRPERPRSGPAAPVDISLGDENTQEIVNDLSYPFSTIDLTTKENRDFVKPDIGSPKNLMNFMNSQTTSCANQPSEIFNPHQETNATDLIKFSASTISDFIPNTVNEESREMELQLPALSGLIGSIESVQQLPAVLESSESNSESFGAVVPDFSGLMSNNGESAGAASSLSTQSIGSSAESTSC